MKELTDRVFALNFRRCTDPVVANRLIGVKNSRNTLSSMDIDVLHHDGVVLNTVGLNEGEIVLVDRECEEWMARERE